MELIAALIAFTLVTLTAMIIGLLTPRQNRPAKRKPQITEYRGPYFNAHGREVERSGRRVL